MAEELNERSQNILEAIVEDYIASAEPIGSRAISRRHSFNLSPASVRNVMSNLEELELITHLHTSGGRIPTDKGYRFYVDSLMKKKAREYTDTSLRAAGGYHVSTWH